MDRADRPAASWLPRLAGSAVLLLAVGIAGITFAMWPRDDLPDQPDAIIVLGGAGVERAQLGIELRDRYDATLALSSSAWGYAYNLGARCDEDALCFSPYPATTTGEALTVTAMAESLGWDQITVATSTFHTTRSRVLFRQCLGDRVTVVGAKPADPRGIRTHVREAIGTLAALTLRRAC